MRPANVLALAASLSSTTVSAVSQGFNYGAANSDGSVRYQADFQREFKLAKELPGASGFTSARLYTTIQGGSSTNEPIQAIPAAIAEGTTLLLGLWASGGDGWFSAEIIALQAAIQKWGSSFTDLVVGISVGSEDLYRISPTGIAAKSGYGAEPQTIARYVAQLREAIRNTPLANSPIGHVDTWTAWVNGSNQAVINSVDWVGVNAFPYFQNSQSNAVSSGKSLYEQALVDTRAAVGGKDLWLTETGWPVSGKTENLALPSAENARQYWLDVGCPRFGKVNTWWYTLQDATPVVPNPSFGIVGANGQPVFDLSCAAASSSTSSSAAPSSTTRSSSGSGSGSASSSTSSAASSAASSASSQASSVASSIASNPPVSSGGGLSPTDGGGEVVIPSLTESASGPFPTGSNISVSVGQPTTALTTQTTVVRGSGTSGASSSPTSSTTAGLNNSSAASTLSASIIGAVFALMAAVMVL